MVHLHVLLYADAGTAKDNYVQKTCSKVMMTSASGAIDVYRLHTNFIKAVRCQHSRKWHQHSVAVCCDDLCNSSNSAKDSFRLGSVSVEEAWSNKGHMHMLCTPFCLQKNFQLSQVCSKACAKVVKGR